MDTLLSVQGLTKRFGRIVAVDGVDFTVGRGEVLGFLGPNGAGKSTTMKMVTGYLHPTAGTAAVCGFDVVERPLEAKQRLGYLPEGAPLYGDMTPSGLLDFVGRVRGLRSADRKARQAAVVDRLQLGAVLHRPVETLSKGFKRRVGLAQALLADPDLLILDEPTDGLDPNQKHEVRSLLAELAAEKAIVISTHLLEEVEAVCTRAIIIAGGRVVTDAKPDELFARSTYHNAVSLRVAADRAEAAKAAIESLGPVRRVEIEGPVNGVIQLVALPSDGADILTDVRTAMSSQQIPVSEIFVERGRLDEVFRRLTGGREDRSDA